MLPNVPFCFYYYFEMVYLSSTLAAESAKALLSLSITATQQHSSAQTTTAAT